MPRSALIVGAGIGGLAAGLALRRAGWTVTIFERTSSPRELGFGLGLAPNGINALRDLGVADAVIARGFAPLQVTGEVRRLDGRVLKRASIPVRDVLGGPMVVALRAALHGTLLEAVGSEVVRTSSEVVAIGRPEDQVSVTLANKDTVAGDLIVGADGIGSIVRRTLHPTERPARSSGIVAVRGAVDGMLDRLLGHAGIYYLGPGVESMFIRAGETGIYWFVSLAAHLLPTDIAQPAAVVEYLAPRFDSTFRAITSATTDLRFDQLADRDPLSTWGRGSVTLLGDAAHPMLPHTGQGAAQAIVDAVALGKGLQRDANIPTALRTYERSRQQPTAVLVRQGRRTARVMRMTNPLGCHVRDWVIRLAPIEPLMRIFVRVNRRAGTATKRSATS